MLVASFVTNRPTMGDTRTYEDFSKFLGERPHRLGVVSRLYPELTATFLTEALRERRLKSKEGGTVHQNLKSRLTYSI